MSATPRVTRSVTGASKRPSPPVSSSTPQPDSSRKRPRKSAPRVVPATPQPAPAIQSASVRASINLEDMSEQIIVRPALSFDIEAAKRHLVGKDPRFASLFATLKCKPFEEDADLNPFRALCSSILGQQVSPHRSLIQPMLALTDVQISWLAARSITHKFIRLVAFPDLPEKPAATGMISLFPTPLQVAQCPMPTLRSAGLSQRKAEYVVELAQRFVDGRLTARSLMDMSDEEVMKALVEVRGIGRWTVEMFMIFTLRRPDVLPVGDLGVQKGLVRWMTMVNPAVHARKLPETPGQASRGSASNGATTGHATPAQTGTNARQDTPPPASSGPAASEPSTPLPASTPGPPSISTPANDPNGLELPLMTPTTEAQAQLPPFPESKTLTRQSLKARLSKKVKGNNYLTPQEMEELSTSALLTSQSRLD